MLWRREIFASKFSFRREIFVGIKANFKGTICYFVSVYSSCNLEMKRKMWEQLITLKMKWSDGKWCVAGDFNSIRNLGEMVGCREFYRSKESLEFIDFIELMELVDLPTGGKKNSWCRGS